jgi:hypothetical protein
MASWASRKFAGVRIIVIEGLQVAGLGGAPCSERRAVQFDDIGAARSLMKSVDVLRDNCKLGVRKSPLRSGQRMMSWVRRRGESLASNGAEKAPNFLWPFRNRFRGSEFSDTRLFPEATLSAVRTQPRCDRDSGASENDNAPIPINP